MSKATVELQVEREGQIETVLRKEVEIPDAGFPDIAIYKDEVYALVDWESNISALYVKTTSFKISHEPVIVSP